MSRKRKVDRLARPKGRTPQRVEPGNEPVLSYVDAIKDLRARVTALEMRSASLEETDDE